MKNFLILNFIWFTFIYGLHSQTAVGGCNTVTLTSVPYYQPYYYANWQVCSTCESQCYKWATSIPQVIQTRSWLERKNSNGTWSTVQGGSSGISGDNVVFSNVQPGIYRIYNQKARKRTTGSCSNGFVIYYQGAQTGFYQGEMSPTYNFTDFSYSNEVFVGPVQQNQVTYQFVDGGGGNSAESGFDFNEIVRINTTGCQNFTHWWVAIFENDGPMRYTGIGWQTGPLPTLVNLTDVWKLNNPTWQFETFRSYTVQFALSNPCNQYWTNLDKTFFICPSGAGCREIEEVEPISLSPNPTFGQFELRNLTDEFATITVLDMSGRELKRFSNSQINFYDVSDLHNGIYLVSVIQNGKRIFNSKLSILK